MRASKSPIACRWRNIVEREIEQQKLSGELEDEGLPNLM